MTEFPSTEDAFWAVLAEHLRDICLPEPQVRLILAAPLLFAEHERTLAQLFRMTTITQHLGRTQQLAAEIDAAVRGTLQVLKAARGSITGEYLRSLVSATPEAIEACWRSVAPLLDEEPSTVTSGPDTVPAKVQPMPADRTTKGFSHG